ncbi:hypothetical protein N0V90_000262 [Kalmusia sp. IMI 367209]|nr:hypothetical protein N0V90_000262 [Kalmusia sp. IMI 367209]
MSADLFAEFGSSSNSATGSAQQQKPAQQPEHRSAPAFSFFDDFTGAPATTQGQISSIVGSNTQQDADDNEDWGDFEGGASSFDPAPPAKHDPFTFSTSAASRAPAPSWQVSSETNMDPFSSFQPVQSTQTTWQKAPVVKAKRSADPSVLFDAEDDFAENDFGDFEEPESIPATVPSVPANSAAVVDLLGGLDFMQATVSGNKQSASSSHKASKSASLRSSTSGFGSVVPNQRAKIPPTSPVSKNEDSWDTFDDWEATIPTKTAAKATSRSPKKKDKIAIDSKTVVSPPPVLSPTFDDPQPGELPPTNVPPPAVLLTLFPPLFLDAHNKLFKPMAAQTLPMRNKVLAEPATITYLQGYIMLASVAAHIIAGRKLRWKRDQHLSQGMRIGPASSRATSGMKLSSIDKSENLKEEREASDVVRAWKDQTGRLRHVVSAANQIKAGSLGGVPDIQETMPVKVLRQGEGGVPAAQPCMLCGLKRDERVGAVDQDVEDSFGEWWVEQVNMHRSCRNFWGEHKDKLRQR